MSINLKILPQVGVTFSLIGVQVVQHLCGATHFMELIINSKRHGQHTVYYDDEDHELISKHRWHIHKGKVTYYAGTTVASTEDIWYNGKRKRNLILMHRLILKAPLENDVDHKDHNGLNNYKSNLRMCSNQQNVMNSKIKRTNISGYKGISFYKPSGKYQASIMLNKKQIHLGYFNTDVEAAKKYNEAAIKYFGEFAYLNKFD